MPRHWSDRRPQSRIGRTARLGWSESCAPAHSRTPTPAVAVAPAPAPEPILYQRNGQGAARTAADRELCRQWARRQPGAGADPSVFQRAQPACLDGREHSARRVLDLGTGGDCKRRGGPPTLGGSVNWIPPYSVQETEPQSQTDSLARVFDAHAPYAPRPRAHAVQRQQRGVSFVRDGQHDRGQWPVASRRLLVLGFDLHSGHPASRIETLERSRASGGCAAGSDRCDA